MIANADRVRNYCEEHEIEALFADGLDDAVIGLTRDLSSGAYRVVYDTARVVHVLINDHGMDYDEAVEKRRALEDAAASAGRSALASRPGRR
jgi:hypothetical protein